MVHDPEPESTEDWEDNDQLLTEDDFELDLEEEELDLLQELMQEAAAAEWIVTDGWHDTRDQPDD